MPFLIECRAKNRGTQAINRNKEIGLRVKHLREKRRISQAALGEAIGVSYQQVQKYENGTTPLTVKRLEEIARVLRFDLSDFLSRSPAEKVGEKAEDYEYLKVLKGFPGVLSEDEARLLKTFRSLVNERLKKMILSQTKTIATLTREHIKKKRA